MAYLTRLLRSTLDLSRPWAWTTIAFLVTGIRVKLSHGPPDWLELLPSSIAIALIVAGGFALNDVFDRHIDTKAHPDRVIPSGRLAPRTVLWLSIATLAGGEALLSLSGVKGLLIGAAAVALLGAYSPLKNAHGLLGNVVVALLVVLAIFFAYAMSGASVLEPPAVVLAGTAFSLMLSREFAKDVEDMNAESALRKTMPIQVGDRTALRIAAGFLLLAVMLPLTLFAMDSRYLGLVFSVPVTAYGILVAAKLTRAKQHQASVLVRMMKYEMILLVVLFVAVY